MHDPSVLPPDLPRPVDDGAALHLPCARLPQLSFPATTGGEISLGSFGDGLILFVYPRTGRPGVAPPVGWDETPGARGCTPQACAFRDLYSEIRATGLAIAGLSAQDADYQQEAAKRLHLPFPLLADPELRLADALALPTFEIAGMRLYKRLTLVAEAGVITTVFYPVFPPDTNAADVLAWLRGDRAT